MLKVMPAIPFVNNGKKPDEAHHIRLLFPLPDGSPYGGSDRGRLLKIGTIQEGDPAYTLEFVQVIKDPSQITGVIVTPKKK
jgi:hypothetical protein